jgi:hypothetical protein
MMLRPTAIAVVLLAASAAAERVTLNSTAFTALLLGDWGGQDKTPYTEPGQVACAAGMAVTASQYGANAAFLLGDNFYSSGIHGSAYDARFQETFEGVYTAASLQNIPFYVVAGNHDHAGNVSAQIAYTKVRCAGA